MWPNVLTLIRLALVPFILWLATASEPEMVAGGLGLFLIAGITDWLDGYLAHRWDQVTPFGTLMDPLVDKVLILSLLIVFAHMGLFPLWIALVHLFREMLVSGVRRIKALQGELVGANWMGKTKFMLQIALIIGIFIWLVLRAAGRVSPDTSWIYVGAVAVTTVSVGFGLVFFLRHARDLFTSPEAEGKQG